ncbi:MAG: DNA (cytosine-5-)-methyltransferase [Bacteroidota bacterium]|nr:DNA (cytosine-5-)-methyltransferase [Bacteroidota bacterium]
MKRAIDLYSGIGGWTLGMKLSEIENVASFEWWKDANQTHNFNFGTAHREINIREINIEQDLIFDQPIDFVVGSPPCTQFSFANKGGNGNIADGLVDIYKFLEIVAFLKPKYWAMENIPRVAGILKEQIEIGGQLHKFKELISVIEIIDASDFGVPQSRKRMIAGNFPFELFNSYKLTSPKKSLGDVLSSLGNDLVIDTNYGYQLPKNELTDSEFEPDLSKMEARINKDMKSFHPVYNNMSFPDNTHKPARTVTATCTRVSRESIVVKSDTGYRRLSVRERGVIQGFPITYQFYGKTLNSKFKMIGNAVPPIITYYIFQSMLGTEVSKIITPDKAAYKHEAPSVSVPVSKFDNVKANFPVNRKFMYAIPHLRYGSGVRFELSNSLRDTKQIWSLKFFYGNSKNIKSITLNADLYDLLLGHISSSDQEKINFLIEDFLRKHKDINSDILQNLWITKEFAQKPFDFIDEIGEMISKADIDCELQFDIKIIEDILKEKNKKIDLNSRSVILGFIILSKINEIF